MSCLNDLCIVVTFQTKCLTLISTKGAFQLLISYSAYLKGTNSHRVVWYHCVHGTGQRQQRRCLETENKNGYPSNICCMLSGCGDNRSRRKTHAQLFFSLTMTDQSNTHIIMNEACIDPNLAPPHYHRTRLPDT